MSYGTAIPFFISDTSRVLNQSFSISFSVLIVSKQLTLVLDDRGGPAARRSEGAVLHSSGRLQHHGSKTYLHRVGTVMAPPHPRSGGSRVDRIRGNAPRTHRVLFDVQLLAETEKRNITSTGTDGPRRSLTAERT